MTTTTIANDNAALEEHPEVGLFPEGFLAIHNGLFEHLQQGRMTPSMLAAYVVLLQQTDWSSGRWNGNSHRLYAAFGGRLSLSQVRRTLASLERAGYIKTFKTQGRRGNYFVLVDKYRVRLGEVKGLVLNASKSMSWEHPVYEPRSENEVRAKSGVSDRYVRRESGVSEAEVRTKSQRSDMRPYQEEQDVSDVREDKEVNTLTSSTSTTAAAVDAADEKHTPLSQTPRASGSATPLTDKEAFFVKQEVAWSNEHVNLSDTPLRATKSHLDESYLAYQKYGNRYFDSLYYWLDKRASDDLLLSEHNERVFQKTWTLKAFLDHGLLVGLEMTKPKTEPSPPAPTMPEYRVEENMTWLEEKLKDKHIRMGENGKAFARQQLSDGAIPADLFNRILKGDTPLKITPSAPAVAA